jgi:hypothetical protein
MTEPNMTLDGLDEFLSSDAYGSYAEHHAENVEPEGHPSLDRVVERTRDVIRNGRESPHYDTVTNYLARAKAQYARNGAGKEKHAGTARNVVALRTWGYDPYHTFT